MELDPNQPQSTPVTFSPYAQREIQKVQDDYARAAASGQYDEDQMMELWDKSDERISRLRQAGAVEAPDTSLERQFDQQVIERNGTMYQANPDTGEFSVLSEPVKDMRQLDEIEFDQRAKNQETRNKFIQQRASMTNAEGQPLYSIDQIEQEANRLYGQQQNQIAQPQSKAERDALPSGSVYMAPDGSTRIKR